MLQFLCIFIYSYLALIFLSCNLLVFFFPKLLYLWIPYLIYSYFDKSPYNGKGRSWKWFRSSKFWKYAIDYFPIKIVKTADLDPKKKYIFVLHPHGIISYGAGLTFTYSPTFSQYFPGLEVLGLVNPPFFFLPLVRDLVLWVGAMDARRKYADRALDRGKSVFVVPGGALEALEAHPSTYKLRLKDEMGFCRLAMHNQAEIVPVFVFGENDIFKQVSNPPGSLVRKIQLWLSNLTLVSFPLYYGVIGATPYRHPITLVFGAPLPVPHVPRPSGGKQAEAKNIDYVEQVSLVHQEYLEQLTLLYEKHKDQFPSITPQGRVVPRLEFF